MEKTLNKELEQIAFSINDNFCSKEDRNYGIFLKGGTFEQRQEVVRILREIVDVGVYTSEYFGKGIPSYLYIADIEKYV